MDIRTILKMIDSRQKIKNNKKCIRSKKVRANPGMMLNSPILPKLGPFKYLSDEDPHFYNGKKCLDCLQNGNEEFCKMEKKEDTQTGKGPSFNPPAPKPKKVNLNSSWKDIISRLSPFLGRKIVMPNLYRNCKLTTSSKQKNRLDRRSPVHVKWPNYICTAHCRYDIVRQIASKFGMRESQENWNILWSDYIVTCERIKNLRRYQKINHFPGMAEICRKDLLARNLNRMSKLFPKDYDFSPRTWLLPIDLGEVTEYSKRHKSTTYILKPDVGCKGKGIQLTKTVKDLVSLDRTICQVYVPKPYLIDGFKFDLRVYVLITSCDPLRLYVYNEGLVRFATKRYKEPNRTNMCNMYMHLTNYSVNKFSRTYIADPEEGSKRKLSTLNDYLRRQFHDVSKLWDDIDDVIIKTVLLALPTLQHNYKAAFPSHRNRQACFELLGFDLILDNNLKPYLLEVNHSPSFHTDAPIDREVKEALIIDTFKILNLPKNIKHSVMIEDKRNVTNRLLKDLQNTPSSPLSNHSVKPISSEEQLKKLELYEKEHRGNFRKIYPNHKMHMYSVFFCQGTSSLFNETFASRARERVSKLMKEGIQESDIDKLKPFEAITQLTKRSLPVHSNISPTICERITSHNKIRDALSLHSNLPSLLHEKKRIEETSHWSKFTNEQNKSFLKKVNEYAKQVKIKQEMNKTQLIFKQSNTEKVPMSLNKSVSKYNAALDCTCDECDKDSISSSFHWNIHFGVNKNQYKIDSFPNYKS
ncbi:tubulin polyglutamylase TTLL6 isoform X3 [Halyomorpha halys]|uniref:tubulin polyglutamylase TTLL6 isoform X3 n=1 Tax=Halyomorpha halys TaxID=286706 RepID=UPI0006D4FEF5|nr:tubulin polyglutamylase TTLL6-like isoform X3 [Halyomorpha halys]